MRTLVDSVPKRKQIPFRSFDKKKNMGMPQGIPMFLLYLRMVSAEPRSSP